MNARVVVDRTPTPINARGLQKSLQLVLCDPLAQGRSHFHGMPEMCTGIEA
jgi:hypothetical protein